MTVTDPQSFTASALTKLGAAWPTVQRLGAQLGAQVGKRVATFEQQQVEPLLERALQLWGDQREQQRQRLGTLLQGVTVSPAERQINRGLYLSSASLTVALVGRLFYPPLQLLSLPGLVYGTWRLYTQARTTLENERRLDVDGLLLVVNLAYIGGGYWILGNLTTTSYFFSNKLLIVIKERLQQELITALTQQPRQVWTEVQGQEVQRRLDELQAGDVVIVYAGEVLPVDGVIRTGAATVDEHMLTGEARPIEKTVGDRVFTATLVLTGKIAVTVAEAGATTLVARINEVLAQTVDFRSTRQLRMQALTDWLALPTLGLAAMTLPFLGLSAAAAVVNTHPFRQLNNFAALGILNIFVAAANQGILIKDGRSLELLQEVDTLIFDKTGTLTQAHPQVVALYPLAGIDEQLLLAFAAAAEQHQRHPIARAILSAAHERGLTIPGIDEATFKVGLGLVVQAAGHMIHVGSARFMGLSTIPLPTALAHLQAASHEQGHLLVWVARDHSIIGALALVAPLRPEAQGVIDTLRQQTRITQMMIVSGDHAFPTQQAATVLGIDTYYAETLPTGKAELIARLQAEGRKVCFIGDGINDAIALKQAHVSISLSSATMAAIDTAHIVLMAESLAQLPAVFALSQSFARTQRRMMLPVLGTSVLGLVGIYQWGWGLAASTVLDQISLLGGGAAMMQPRLFPGKPALTETTGTHDDPI